MPRINEQSQVNKKSGWELHLRTQLIEKGLSCALIMGVEGNIWAQVGIRMDPSEAVNIVALFQNPSSAYSLGIVIGGVKHFVTSANAKMIRGSKQGTMIIAAKTAKTVLLGIIREEPNAARAMPFIAGNGEVLVGEYADYLRSIHF
eukprot:gnl/Trimastix_PCT/3320.p1 GENE.gnl/Trimastix_PCT/3320~~gnl/Trimastix_PCT/3320.p1  ORF type:complete len:146 (+),score=1.61 gnl/Trimastix_PCT/3320:46-483(+)